jgi:hypothetical protein
MAIQCEQTPPGLVVPDLNLVVVTTRHEQGLSRVEIDSSNGAIVFFKAINESPHAVIPELDCGGVEGDENPWSGYTEVSADAPTCCYVPAGPTYRFGWNAIPLALEDFDSNYVLDDY